MKTIFKCLKFEDNSRPSAIEVLLDFHKYLKKNWNKDGVFSVYNH